MTKEERVEKLRCLIACMKCEVSGKVCDDNCPTQYNAGNMGEIIENLKEIAKTLEQEPTDKHFTKADIDAIVKAINAGWELRVNEVLDKIRAEIAEYGSIMVAYAITKETKTDKGIEKLVSGVLKQAKEQVLDIIDKYKAEPEADNGDN